MKPQGSQVCSLFLIGPCTFFFVQAIALVLIFFFSYAFITKIQFQNFFQFIYMFGVSAFCAFRSAVRPAERFLSVGCCHGLYIYKLTKAARS